MIPRLAPLLAAVLAGCGAAQAQTAAPTAPAAAPAARIEQPTAGPVAAGVSAGKVEAAAARVGDVAVSAGPPALARDVAAEVRAPTAAHADGAGDGPRTVAAGPQVLAPGGGDVDVRSVDPAALAVGGGIVVAVLGLAGWVMLRRDREARAERRELLSAIGENTAATRDLAGGVRTLAGEVRGLPCRNPRPAPAPRAWPDDHDLFPDHVNGAPA